MFETNLGKRLEGSPLESYFKVAFKVAIFASLSSTFKIYVLSFLKISTIVYTFDILHICVVAHLYRSPSSYCSELAFYILNS